MSIDAYTDSGEPFVGIGAYKNKISGENTGSAYRLTEQSVKGGTARFALIAAKGSKAALYKP